MLLTHPQIEQPNPIESKSTHTYIHTPLSIQIYLAHFYIWVLYIAPWVVLFAPTQARAPMCGDGIDVLVYLIESGAGVCARWGAIEV